MKFPYHNANDGFLNNCHISGKNDLIELIDLGNQPLSDTLIDEQNLKKKEKYFPLKILRSPTLGHSQLNFIVPHDELYHPNYPYRPGITKEIILHHSEQAKINKKKYNIQDGELIVDIGSNDGTLLQCYKENGFAVLGIEPTNMADVANKNGVETIKSVFDEKTAQTILKSHKKPKLITATNVFAHMASLGSVMQGVLKLLDNDSFFIIENHNMKDIIKYNQYDSFYHEHIRNYSFTSLKYLFELYNLKVVDAEVIERYNGSIKVVVTKNHKISEYCEINAIIKDEINFGLFDDKIWNEFKNNILKSKADLVKLLIELKKQGKTIVANSCPARCSTLINFCDIGTDLIPYIAEQPSSFKLNKYLPGKRIPIVNNSRLFIEQPDYVLILAWHLSKPIIQQLKERGLKSKFIIPLPEITLI
jgi:hypothetical protein